MDANGIDLQVISHVVSPDDKAMIAGGNAERVLGPKPA